MNLQKRQAVRSRQKFANFSIYPTACYEFVTPNLFLSNYDKQPK